MRQISYLSAPIHIWWDITHQCNFNCKHCYSKASPNSYDELTTKEVLAIIDQLKSIKIGYVYVLGGEPLIRPDFDIILEYFTKLEIPLMLNTNGWFIDKSWVSKLLNSSLRHLRFSIDGSKADIHDVFRQKGSFDRVVNGITLCREAGISPISCSFTMTKDNINEIRPTVELLILLGVDEVQFGPISGTGRAAENKGLLLDKYDTSKITNILKECIDTYSEKIHIYSVDGTYDRPCTTCVKKGIVKPNFMGCTAGRTCCCIDSDGKVIPCLLWRDPVAGSLRETSFRDIWNYSALFQHLRRHRGDEYPECDDCCFGDVCARECPLSSSQTEYESTKRLSYIQSLGHRDNSKIQNIGCSSMHC